MQTQQIYKGEYGPEHDKARYKQFMETYFHDVRDQVWNRVSNVHHHPEQFHEFGQTAFCNILLHGPPGTGKSSFAARLTKTLGRSHLISINLLEFINCKSKLYSYLANHKFLPPIVYIYWMSL